MKTALLALLFLAAMVAVEASPKRERGGDDRRGPGRREENRETIEALAEDNGVLEWFFLEEDEDECASSANANEIPIEEAREGRKRGKKGPKLPALREAREE